MRGPRKRKLEVFEDADSLFEWLKKENEQFLAEHPTVTREVSPTSAHQEIRETVVNIAERFYDLHDC